MFGRLACLFIGFCIFRWQKKKFFGLCNACPKNKTTLQRRDRRLRRNPYLQALRVIPVAQFTGYVSSLRICLVGRWLPLELQCGLYQGQQDDATNLYKNPFLRGTKSDGCGKNPSNYHVYPVSRITGEGTLDFLKGGGGRTHLLL